MPRRGPLVAVALMGCASCVAVPPVRARLGGSFRRPPAPYDDPVNGPTLVRSELDASVGVHSASALERPYDIGAGVRAAASGDQAIGALYLEGGWLRWLQPGWRLGLAGAGDWWFDDGQGIGARASVTIERTTRHRYGTTDDDGGCIPSKEAIAGRFAVGGYVEVGHRIMFEGDDVTTMTAGVSLRLAAYALVATGFPEHCD